MTYRYFVSYMAINSKGVVGYGDCEIGWSRPINDSTDMEGVKKQIKDDHIGGGKMIETIVVTFINRYPI